MRYILIAILIFISMFVKSQHSPIYSQYMMNGLVINPAYAGSRDVLSAVIAYRNQWVGFEGAPVTMSLSAHWPFKNKSIAAGLLLMNEKIGITNNFSCFGNYAYRFRTDKGYLSLGIKAGIEMLKEDQSKISTQDPDDIFTNNQGYLLPNFGLGVYYYTPDFFAGASIPTILSYREENLDKSFKAYNNTGNYNYLLCGGILLKINDNLTIKPSTLLKYHPNSPFQYDLNCNFILLKGGVLWAGVSYRAPEAIVALVEFQLNSQIRLGYSYDYSLGVLSKYNSGTHEVMLRYEFKYIVSTVNPKFF